MSWSRFFITSCINRLYSFLLLIVVTQLFNMGNSSSHWFWKDSVGCKANKLGPVFVLEVIASILALVLFFYMFNLASAFYSTETFHKTTCHVVEVNSTQWLPCSDCSQSFGTRNCSIRENVTVCEAKKRCYESRFPCAQIQVSYEIADKRSFVSSLQKYDWKKNPYPQVINNSVLYNNNNIFIRT